MGKSPQEALQECVHMETRGSKRADREMEVWLRTGDGHSLPGCQGAKQFWGRCLCRGRLEITVLRKPLVTGLEV